MSLANGNRSRAHVQARYKLKMRARLRELRAKLSIKIASAGRKPDRVAMSKIDRHVESA